MPSTAEAFQVAQDIMFVLVPGALPMSAPCSRSKPPLGSLQPPPAQYRYQSRERSRHQSLPSDCSGQSPGGSPQRRPDCLAGFRPAGTRGNACPQEANINTTTVGVAISPCLGEGPPIEAVHRAAITVSTSPPCQDCGPIAIIDPGTTAPPSPGTAADLTPALSPSVAIPRWARLVNLDSRSCWFHSRMILALDKWFWRHEYWFPPGFTWEDIKESGSISYPKPRDLLHIVPYALLLVGVQYLFQRVLYTSFYSSMEQYQPFFGYYFMNALLMVLQLLHVFWASLIIHMLYKFINGTLKNDARSDTEESDESEEVQEQNKKEKNGTTHFSNVTNNCSLSNGYCSESSQSNVAQQLTGRAHLTNGCADAPELLTAPVHNKAAQWP
ncbi:hypothetical protein KIL84_008552 [Mauremys mutica]|uniref:Uncharacterized protein n=1 Tax=Mauremys mutica TaxID=74926 RepID=A0A9D3X7B7_9SAUR|nr:hypothetical protein KIL84_008552 [Mauremys mutica]